MYPSCNGYMYVAETEILIVHRRVIKHLVILV